MKMPKKKFQHTGIDSRIHFKGFEQDGCTEGVPAYNPLRDADKLPVLLRAARPEDAPFIFSSWLASFESQNKDQPKKTIQRFHRRVITRLLENSITMVAALDTDPNEIIGWACGERASKFLIMHYVYTKEIFRRLGVQNTLMAAYDYTPGEQIMVSHKGYICKDLRPRYNIKYVPHLQHKGGTKQLKELYKCE